MSNEKTTDHFSLLPTEIFEGPFFPCLDVPTLNSFSKTNNSHHSLVTNYFFPPSLWSALEKLLLPNIQEEHQIRINHDLNPFLEKENIPEWKDKLTLYRRKKFFEFRQIFQSLDENTKKIIIEKIS